MQISFSSTNSSSAIKDFEAVKHMPDFVVLTGLNGSGKTHLLKAIQQGLVKVNEIDVQGIRYYSHLDFRVASDSVMNEHQLKSECESAWKSIQGTSKVNGASIQTKKISEQVYKNAFLHEGSQTEGKIDFYQSKIEDIGLNIWSDISLFGNDDVIEMIKNYCRSVIDDIFSNPAYAKHPNASAITAAIKAVGKPIHLISKEEFSAVYMPFSRADDFLSASIGSVFTAYKVRQYRHYHDEWEKSNFQITREELEETFEGNHQKPWEIMNEILKTIRSYSRNQSCFDFSITDPGNEVLRGEDITNYVFTPKLIDNKTGEDREFKLLSSGEQVLLALSVAIFESQRGFEFPKIILLDEVDATLHPSMIRALIRTIKDVFMRRGTKVIMATHSPTTVALAEDNEIYVVNPGVTPNKIESKSREDAMSIITEGFMTLEHGFSTFNEVSKHDICIVTEGNNSKIIRKALTIFGEGEVEVISGVENRTGKNQLKVLYEFFRNIPRKTKALFVVDVDVKISDWKAETENTFLLALPKNCENNLTTKGIENMFSEEAIRPYVKEVYTKCDGKEELLGINFNDKEKSEFASHISLNGTEEDFQGFACLMEKIADIRNL